MADSNMTEPLISEKDQTRFDDFYENEFAKKNNCFSSWFSRLFSRTPATNTDSLDEFSFPEFPKLDQENFGENMKADGYNEVERSNSKIYYKDLKKGSGNGAVVMDDTAVKLQRVEFDYNLYNSSSNNLVYTNKSGSKRSPKVLHLCGHNFGSGFEKGIQGMITGGIRRIVIPQDLTSQHPKLRVGEYAIFDVKLLKVGKSWVCYGRSFYTHDNEDP